MRTVCSLVAAAVLAGCVAEREPATSDTAAPATAVPDTANADPDAQVAGASGVPAGYTGRTDRGDDIAAARYASRGGAWEITTGPAHIVYAAKDSASGVFTARATIEQLEAPTHPEAFGLFVGGQNLDQPSQQYTYFLVRGTGEYLVKVREGDRTRTVVNWTASNAVPKADASGKASYRLAVRVGTDSVRFLVNDTPVAAAPRSAVPTNGVAGLRINHNLHVQARPLEISRS